VREAGLAFIRQHPADPCRWELVTTLAETPFAFLKTAESGPKAGTAPAAVFDEPALLAWQEELRRLQQALIASTDATDAQREAAEWALFGRDVQACVEADEKGEPQDLAPLQARFEAHLAKYADQDVLADRASEFLYGLDRFKLGASAESWRRMLTAPGSALRARAAEQLAELERMGRPQELAFTALDGREVDLAKLRGKVVLLDFWATWCGPCVAELPNVKRIYASYRDKRFEVIGIALENAKLVPADTPEQAAEKVEKARKTLAEFTAAHEMPWPQYCDGKYWQNDIAPRYQVWGIPAMFLLDQQGRIVAIDVRGPRLEAEVKRLLAL
jgi:thiol-disulfide isomerase/thioredoxin